MIPAFFHIKVLFVRTDVLEKLGVTEYLRTINELIDASIAVTDKKSGPYGFALRGKHSEFSHSDYRDQYTVIPMPVGQGGIGYLYHGFVGLGITSYSEHKEETLYFLAFMVSTDVNGLLQPVLWSPAGPFGNL